jgi:hypothetical protein
MERLGLSGTEEPSPDRALPHTLSLAFRVRYLGCADREATLNRTVTAIMLAATIFCCTSTVRAADDNLYRAQTIVTGQGEANRIIGFALCLEDVLIKVSGALGLAGDARLEPYKAKAGDFVSAYDYHDQMSGTPKRDEQGTRDRPYDLIVDFDRKKIDDVLAKLGLKPWPLPRPRLGVLIEMEQGQRQFIVTSDAKQSDLERHSLSSAASKRGMAIVLPSVAALEKSNVTAAALMTLPLATLSPVVAGEGREVVLRGHLTWSDQDLGWINEWQMDFRGQPHRWQFRGVTFDKAFRRALGGAAQILSGNGEPG